MSPIPSNRTEIQAVHDEDLKTTLDNLGELHGIEEGSAKCGYCGEVMSLSSLLAYYPDSGRVRLVCDSNECATRLYEAIRTNKVRL